MKKYSLKYPLTRDASSPRTSGKLLTNTQKAKLCILAKEAYALQFSPEDFATWRRQEQAAALRGNSPAGSDIGERSLTDCTQSDYLKLKAHFERLGGEGGDALRTETRAATDDRRVALWKLNEALTERGLDLAYAAAICRDQNKCALSEATAKQLWRCIFTVRNRRKPTKPAKS